MRKSFDTLAMLVSKELGRDVLDGEIFVFVGKTRRRAKVLYFDGTGLCVLAKRLEKGRLPAPWQGRPEQLALASAG
jgi:transposase